MYTLQESHSSTSLEAGKAALQVPQHKGEVPELHGRRDSLDQPRRRVCTPRVACEAISGPTAFVGVLSLQPGNLPQQ
jgi:hypothetical protein